MTPLLPALLVPLAAAAPPADGWITLFDGESLDGWTTRGGRYDGNAVWKVEDGAIVGREGENHAGGLLYTETPYADFEFEAEVFVSWGFDSGVFVRMRPDARGAQVTLDYRPGGEVGAIYADGFFHHNTVGAERWERDAWNHVRVRCAGDPMHLVFWLNGERLTDFRMPAGREGFARTGLVGVQVHGGQGVPPTSHASFRNVRLRPLPEGAGDYFTTDERGFDSLTAAGEAAGWRALFNGEDLTGWTAAGDGTGYRAEGGVLAFLAEGGSPYLATDDDYEDFQLRLDFRTARLANSGLFLRSSRAGGNPAFSGAEVQILDDFHWEEEKGGTLRPYQFTGGLYGAVAPRAKDALRPLGEWNTYEITALGSRLTCYLNGRLLWDVDTHALEPEQGPPFAERARSGFLGLQRHADPNDVEGDAYAWFRNLFVRRL